MNVGEYHFSVLIIYLFLEIAVNVGEYHCSGFFGCGIQCFQAILTKLSYKYGNYCMNGNPGTLARVSESIIKLDLEKFQEENFTIVFKTLPLIAAPNFFYYYAS